MRDLESIDPEYHKSLQWMLDNDITGVIDQEFTIEDDSFGEKKIVELKEGGAKIEVTEENKDEYIRLALCVPPRELDQGPDERVPVWVLRVSWNSALSVLTLAGLFSPAYPNL
jgi:hypothetical protein